MRMESVTLDIWLTGVAFALTCLALNWLGRKDRYAFLVFAVGCTINGYVFWRAGQWFLVAQMVVINLYNIRNFILWKQ